MESPKTKIVGLILGPLLFIAGLNLLALTSLGEDAIVVVSMGAWMVCWWVTEAVPIPAAALLPIVILPLFSEFTVREVTQPYGDSIIFLFMGGFIIALALEKHNLHKRIALNLIRITGTSGNGIILGFMLATALISMWISNTATAVMMLPIATSVTQLLATEVAATDERRYKKFATGLMLSIAYAASIGGMATIIGTPPNVITVGYIKRFYDQDVSFADWMIVGVPLMLAILTSCYLLITKVLYRNHLASIPGSTDLIKRRLSEMGKLSLPEKCVLVIFSLACFSWVFRQSINQIIGHNLLTDTTIAMTGGLLMFITPIDIKKGVFVLDWNDMRNMPWGILLLFGGGLSLAQGMEDSGLVELLGQSIKSSGPFSLTLLVVTLGSMSMFLTEMMSNTALTTIMVPVALGIADGLKMEPVLLAMAVCFSASCAFMLPVSTPPNAVLFASGHIKIGQMMRAGFLLNLISLAFIILAVLTLGKWVFI